MLAIFLTFATSINYINYHQYPIKSSFNIQKEKLKVKNLLLP